MLANRKAALLSGSGKEPIFFAPLKTNVFLAKGAGPATFTRASTATVTDFEGIIRTVKSGEVRFEGARRVENAIISSENPAAWTKTAVGTGVTPTVTANYATAPDGTNTAIRIQTSFTAPSPTDADYSYVQPQQTILVAGSAYRKSVWIRSNTGVNQDVQTNISGNPPAQVVVATPNWQRLSPGLANSIVFGARGANGNLVIDVLVWHPQLELAIGQANQNPSEYVPVGVTAAPYHGCNVDGVKYFDTLNGNTVSNNVVTEAPGAAIPDATLKGYFAEGARTNLLKYSSDILTGIKGVTTNQSGAWITAGNGSELITNNTFATDATGWGTTNATLSVASGELVVTNTATNGSATQMLSGLTVGVTYFASMRSRIGTGTNARMTLGTTAGGTEYYTNQINSGSAFTIFTSFVATSTTCYVSLVAVGTTGQTAYFDTVSLQRATIQLITTPVVSLDGSANAYGLKAEAANSIFKGAITGTAASYAMSVYLKRKTGTGTISISADGTNFTDVTINDTTWTSCIDVRTLTAATYNPTLKIGTSGDEVYVWGFQEETSTGSTTAPSSIIQTTTASVTRATDLLSYPISGNYNESVGTAYAEYFFRNTPDSNMPRILGLITTLLSVSPSTIVLSYDGVNQAYLSGTVKGVLMKSGITWITTLRRMAIFANGSGGTGTANSAYDGGFGIVSVAISSYNTYAANTTRNVKIWKKALSDVKLKEITS